MNAVTADGNQLFTPKFISQKVQCMGRKNGAKRALRE